MPNQYDFRVLKTLRRKQNLTLQDMAGQCDLTYATVAGIETNKTSPSLKTLIAIARQFEMSASQLLTLCEKPDMVQKTAQKIRDPLDTQDILGLDKCNTVSFGDIRVIHAQASAGEVIKASPLHPDVFEICYGLSGKTCITCKSRDSILSKYEAVLFDAGIPHEYRQIEDGEFIIIYIPKTSQELSRGLFNIFELQKSEKAKIPGIVS